MDSDNQRYTAYFRKMYRAHDTVAAINARIQRLYDSAAPTGTTLDGMPKAKNPHRLENTLCRLADLEMLAGEVLKQRARFDLWVCQLDLDCMRLLDLKFEQGAAWKEVAAELDISNTQARRVYNLICREADKAGLIADE